MYHPLLTNIGISLANAFWNHTISPSMRPNFLQHLTSIIFLLQLQEHDRRRLNQSSHVIQNKPYTIRLSFNDHLLYSYLTVHLPTVPLSHLKTPCHVQITSFGGKQWPMRSRLLFRIKHGNWRSYRLVRKQSPSNGYLRSSEMQKVSLKNIKQELLFRDSHKFGDSMLICCASSL